jgi:hypothetical protein
LNSAQGYRADVVSWFLEQETQMNPTWSFVAGVGLTMVVSLTVVMYLRSPLQKLLTDLCGNQERAGFWTAFSAVTVGVVPVIFALASGPATEMTTPQFMQIAEQLKWGLIGMVLSVLMLGWLVSRFIPRPTPKQ